MQTQQTTKLKKIDLTQQTEKPFLNKLVWDNIPDFAVITGVNGSGKTQLLEWISKNPEYQENCFYHPVWTIPPVDYYPSTSDESEHQKHSLITLHQKKIIENCSQEERKEIQKFVKEYCESKGDQSQYKDTEEESYFFNSLTTEEIRNFVIRNSTLSQMRPQHIFYQFLMKRQELEASAFKKIRQDTKEDLAKEINSQLETIFGVAEAPWDLINKKLEEHGFKHRLLAPSSGSACALVFENGISYNELSSGEQVIFYLIASAYQGNGNVAGKTGLILLDEFDAHLNPAMSRMLIEIVKDILVGQFGIQVIMTTHNPSTAAYTPEENLFWMTEGEIKNKPKNEILKELTPGLVLLEDNADVVGNLLASISAVDIKNILLVEGETDNTLITKAIEALNCNLKVNIVPCKSADNIPFFMRTLKNVRQKNSTLKIVALFDNDNKGQTAKEKLNKDDLSLLLVLPKELEEFKEELGLELNFPIEFLLPWGELNSIGILEKNDISTRDNQRELLNKNPNFAKFFINKLKKEDDKNPEKRKEKLSNQIEANTENFELFKPTLDKLTALFSTSEK